MNHKTSRNEIEKVLSRVEVEKISKLIPVKIQQSLYFWLRKRVGKGRVSSFILEAIFEKLEKMVEADDG